MTLMDETLDQDEFFESVFKLLKSIPIVDRQ